MTGVIKAQAFTIGGAGIGFVIVVAALALVISSFLRRVLRTLVFTDVRSFTSYAERHKPEQVVEVLNRLLEKQS